MEKQANDLSKYRYEKAVQCVHSARYVMGIKDYNLVSNRAYYAIFHAMRAVLALEAKDFEKHSAVISYFRKEYIKTQLFPVEASRIIGNAFDLRNESDYRDWCEVSQEEAEFQLQSAEKFLEMTKEYLDSKDVL